ncbi:MAG: NAD(P)H-hydrate epimerase [Phycisphaerales bacterium JB052]
MQDHQHKRYRAHGPESPTTVPCTPPRYELSVEQARELDAQAVNRYGIPSVVLMENAAIGLHRHAMQILASMANPSVLICCGPGNNGGDGFALARHLHNTLVPTQVVCSHHFEQHTGDAAINLGIIRRMGIECLDARRFLDNNADESPSLLVDALFGTGLTRPVDGVAGELIEWMNTTRSSDHTKVLSVDLPSGLDAQSGEPLGERVVRAYRTVTFAGYKPGMARVEALEYLGETFVASIGAPIELLQSLGTPIEPRHRE